MKKLLLSCLTAAMACGLTIGAHAQEITQIKQNIETAQLEVSVKTDEADRLVLQLLTKGTTSEQIRTFPGGDATELVSDLKMARVDAGETVHNMMLPNNAKTGSYVVRVYSSKTDKVVEKSVYVYASGDIQDYFEDFCEYAKKNDSDSIAGLLKNSEFRGALGVDKEFYTAISADENKEAVIKDVATGLIAEKAQITDSQTLSDNINVYVLFEAMQAGRMSEKQAEKLEQYKTCIGIEENEKYVAFSAMKDEYRNLVLGKLSAYDFADKTEFIQCFAEAVVLAEIQRGGAAKNVAGVMENNKELLKDYDLDKYWDNIDDFELNKYIYEQNFDSFAKLESALADYEISSKGNGGFGGGGAGGGGGSIGGGSVNMMTATGNLNTAKPSRFTDLGNMAWCEKAVNELADRGIISGKADGMFYPADTATRAEIVKMLTLAFNIKTGGDVTLPFEDVARGDWHYNYIALAHESGLVNGVSETEFSPNGLITREDMSVLLWRFIGNAGIANEGTEPVGFIDKGQISDYARDAVAFLRQIGVVSGMDDGTFCPKAPCTRAQVAKMIYSALSYCGK